MEQYAQLINNFGVPIFVIAYFMYLQNTTIKDFTNSINNLNDTIIKFFNN